MSPKSSKKRRTVRNKSHKKRQHGGDGGATGYVGGLFGTLDQQMLNANEHNVIQPLNASPILQTGGKKSRRRGKKGKKQYGGLSPLNPAELSEPAPLQDMAQSHGQKGGQKGGYFLNLLERAIVPFGLIGLQRYAGKRVKTRRQKH
jgi:hypothetical protein